MFRNYWFHGPWILVDRLELLAAPCTDAAEVT
jgi:hypothetical protein